MAALAVEVDVRSLGVPASKVIPLSGVGDME